MVNERLIVPLSAYAHIHANDKQGIKKARKMWRRKTRK
jgi:hypothetical protein